MDILTKLPNADKAVLDIAKLKDYCLNALHPKGQHKARVFATTLGITQKDAEWLREEILVAITKTRLIQTENTPFGSRYTVDIAIERGVMRAVVRTVWIIRNGEDAPRLVTCYVL